MNNELIDFNKGGFFRVTNEAVKQLNDSDFRLYAYLLMRADAHTLVSAPRWRNIVQDLGKSRSAIARGLKRLEHLNVISVRRRAEDGLKSSNAYSFTDPSVWKISQPEPEVETPMKTRAPFVPPEWASKRKSA